MTRKLKTRELNRLTVEAFKQSPKFPATLVLDNIRSAYNVGAVFRTADGFLLEKILLCGITPTPPHKEIYKTAIGAENSMDWEHFADITEALKSLREQGYYIIGLEQTSNSLPLDNWEWKEGTKFALVFGNEVEGISEKALPLCDTFVEIPQHGTKHSFNVSVAAGMLIWDMIKTVKQHEP